MINKHLIKIIIEYIQYERSFKKQLLYFTDYIYQDNLRWRYYENYGIKYTKMIEQGFDIHICKGKKVYIDYKICRMGKKWRIGIIKQK